ncbi:MAG TPA: Rpn family recombination-promoting nuclease/putative transposase, partial [Gemmataceae bacterium]|nr:Rpn family recombination-promoting nuclease/putative transposase [Gemmataceae bacterium]
MAPRIEEIVRHFRENGLKVLLQRPANVRDLLALTRTPLLPDIDFRHLTVDPTSYVAADYRHIASDLVLKVPFRTRQDGRRRTLTLYILIEHQSEPDPLMILRVLEYLVQVYKGQVRAWLRTHRSLAGFRLQPVLPVVLYTGLQRWDDLGRLVEQVDGGALLAELVPEFRPLFVSLPGLPSERLEKEGGYFGWILELVQQRSAPFESFATLVAQVVSQLEEMPAAERDRWLELLSYLVAMIYHDRAVPEREGLRERV